MKVMGLSSEDQKSIFKMTASVMHLGNIGFCESGNYATVENSQCKSRDKFFIPFLFIFFFLKKNIKSIIIFLKILVLAFPSYLLEIQESELNSKLISRKFDSKWGSQSDTINVTLNVEQATYTRDALAKSIYARLFDYLVDVSEQNFIIHTIIKM